MNLKKKNKEKEFEKQMKIMVKQHQIKEKDLQKKYELKEEKLIKEKEKLMNDKFELVRRLGQNKEIFDFYAQKVEEIGLLKIKIEKLELELKQKENEIFIYKILSQIYIQEKYYDIIKLIAQKIY